jgi:dolichol-phosphate mannosyltransferase
VKQGKDPKLSIIIPTFREVMNIPLLVREIAHELKVHVPEWEVIIVDDDSRDGTVTICESLQKSGFPLKLVVRKNERGLARAVIEGFKHARAPIFVVMDGDLSHTPAAVPLLYEAIKNGAEFAIGSRYIFGGETDDKWTFYRYLNSKFASLLARPLVALSDPMSGFFALPRSLWTRCRGLSPVGYKIGLEILVKCIPQNIKEVPIYFRTRELGESKLTVKQQFLYLIHLCTLYRYKFTKRKKVKTC